MHDVGVEAVGHVGLAVRRALWLGADLGELHFPPIAFEEMHLRVRIDDAHALGAVGFFLDALGASDGGEALVLFVLAQEPGARVDVVEAPIVGRCALAAEARRDHDGAVLHARLGGDEIVQVLQDMLLHGGGRLHVFADLGITLFQGRPTFEAR